MNAIKFTLCYSLSLSFVVLALAQDWGAYPYDDDVITDFSISDGVWTFKNKGEIGWGAHSVLPIPQVLETKLGERIPIKNLGYDSSLGKLVFTAEVNGNHWPLSKNIADLNLSEQSRNQLSQYLMKLKPKNGRAMECILLEVSPDLKKIAFATGSKSTLFKPPQAAKGNIVLRRRVYHIQISRLSEESREVLKEIHRKRFYSLVEIASKITGKKIEYYRLKEINDPVDDAAEAMKVKESQERVEENEMAIRKQKEEYELKLATWMNIHDEWKKADNAFSDKLDQLIRMAEGESRKYRFRRMSIEESDGQSDAFWDANHRMNAWSVVASFLKSKRLSGGGSGTYQARRDPAENIPHRNKINWSTPREVVEVMNYAQEIREPRKPEYFDTVTIEKENLYVPRTPWRESQAQEERKLRAINDKLENWDAFIAEQPAANLIIPVEG